MSANKFDLVMAYFDDLHEALNMGGNDQVAHRLLDSIQDYIVSLENRLQSQQSRLDALQGTMKVIRNMAAATGGQYEQQSYRLQPLGQSSGELSRRQPHDDGAVTSVQVGPGERLELDRLFG